MKQEISSLIDRLASKELTLGALVKVNEPVLENLRKKDLRAGFAKNLWIVSDVEAECVRLKNFYDTELGIGTWLGFGLVQELGHPILIGDVLEKMKARFYKLPEVAPSHEKAVEWRYNYAENKRLLINLWEEVGFTKSAQSILSEAVWEEEAVWYAGAPTGASIQVPKQPAIRDLFTLLLQLFPKP